MLRDAYFYKAIGILQRNDHRPDALEKSKDGAGSCRASDRLKTLLAFPDRILCNLSHVLLFPIGLSVYRLLVNEIALESIAFLSKPVEN